MKSVMKHSTRNVRTTRLIAGLVTALSLATAGAVFAQPTDGPGKAHGRHGEMANVDFVAKTNERLAALQTELKLLPTQQSAWIAYATQARQQASAMQTMRTQMQAEKQARGQNAAPPTEAERAARRDSMMKLRESSVAARSVALKDLYTVLTPEQISVVERSKHHGRGHDHGMRPPHAAS